MNLRRNLFIQSRWPLAAALALAWAVLSPRAQDSSPPSPPDTNETAQAQSITPAGAEAGDTNVTATAETTEPDSGNQSSENLPAAATTPGAAVPGPDARTRRQEWIRRHHREASSSEPASAAPETASTTNGPPSLDYSAFRLITQRNIFDPNRQPNTGRPGRPKTVEAFTLVGTMSYEKGVFAFFDGSSSEYRKALRSTDTIAGYRVLAISPDSVKLMHNNQELDLPVGTQLRRLDDGTWVKTAGTETYAANSSAASTESASDASSGGGAESDVLKRLIERRKKEL